jgi:hypothetical protein
MLPIYILQIIVNSVKIRETRMETVSCRWLDARRGMIVERIIKKGQKVTKE